MFSSTPLRASGLIARQGGLRTPVAKSVNVTSKRFQQLDNHGGKSKLVGLHSGSTDLIKDIPVELYPIGFVVGAGVLGGIFALGRHVYEDKSTTPDFDKIKA